MRLYRTEEGWDTSLNDNRYAVKNAFLYSLLVAALLLAPLYLYMSYMKKVYEIQYEFKLKRQSHLVLRAMEDFDTTNEGIFDYPRFRSFESGLYDENFKPIFTLITTPFKNDEVGYHIENDYAYIVMALPEQRYFNASYMVVGGKLSYAYIYENVILILLFITILIFLLSLFFLHRFALPFQRINKRLDRFIKDSMHEINTPLSIINVNIDLFNRSNPSNKHLQRIKAATKTLASLYNDMDYLIKNERLSFEYEQIDLTQYVQERIDYFMEVAALKNITIVSHIEQNTMIHFNPTQLQRLIDNNLSNAIKYSHEGGKIDVTLEKHDNECVLTFQDEGIGIENVDRIFDRYYRENKDKGGFGIGLNIVKSIIDKAGIKLSIDSAYTKGTTFTYTFPAQIYINV